MRYRTLIVAMLLGTATCATAQVSLYIREPHVSIGVNLPVYPEFVRVPGYPVYYAPRVSSNIFFYDGLYWVFAGDRWYASSWYNGPWYEVEPEGVPLYVLRVPVRYYRYRPAYFSAWALDAPPRWGERWGSTWEQTRVGWDRWDRSAVPAAAPLPLYQRQYSGTRYPTLEQQRTIQVRQYRYQPRDTTVRQYYRQLAAPTVTTTTTTTVTNRTAATTRRAQAAQSASTYAPGQLKNQQGTQSAREFAPGQVKKREGAQSAKAYAPGQVKKQQATQMAIAPAQPAPPSAAPAHGRGLGHAKGRGNVENEDQGQGQGRGEGQGHGKGRGHKE